MRRFVLVAHDARTAGDFSLEDLPGSAGRMDLVARCVTASLLVSHGVRADTEFLAVLTGPPRPPRQVRFVGSEIRSLNPDERSTASLIRKTLNEEGLAERSPHRGIYVAGRGLRETLDTRPPPIFMLAEGGTDLRGATLPTDATFVLSDHRDFMEDEETLLRPKITATLSVGPRSLQADQVIAIVHNELDRRG
ncbi:MAG TPA: tRNA (pseudouridine(54)-N(1))-methyltransferase TrmY [Thermoplasmata archaeon]|nr:tRNA (pseudouridine(54)-N(1))-methyltransferase TrmY [Thermoplasmata archaeon]